MSQPKKLRAVRVEWVDSASTGRWRHRKEAERFDVVACTTVGFVVSRNSKRIVLAQSVSEDDDVCDTMTIPAGCVKRVRRLK